MHNLTDILPDRYVGDQQLRIDTINYLETVLKKDRIRTDINQPFA